MFLINVPVAYIKKLLYLCSVNHKNLRFLFFDLHKLMKKTVVMTLLLLLTSVWSMLFAGLQDKQSSMVIPPMDIPLCSPAVVPIDKYLFAFPATDTVVKLPLEYYELLLCTTQSANLLLLPSSIVSESTRDTICSGESYTWNGNTYTHPGTYTDTLTNIYGCDSIVTLNLEVLPDPPITFTVNGVSFNMMRVRVGTFMMGATDDDPDAEADEFPRHEVTLTKDYFIGETEMTQALWQAIMDNNPSEDKSNPQSPVNNVSWDDCQGMIAKLNELTGLTFRLPTEAEWEYAARAGYYSRGYIYAGSNDIDEVAWYNKPYNASVASLKPNEIGVYDMSGSVYEWCQDWYNPDFYASPDHRIDPFQAESVDGRRCARGGSNKATQGANAKKYSRLANRGQGTIDSRVNSGGVRLALEATGIMENNREFVTYDTICAGDTYTWEGDTYTESGSYTKTLQNIYGCDSIVTLHLQVNPTYETQETVVACDSYVFNPFGKIGGV